MFSHKFQKIEALVWVFPMLSSFIVRIIPDIELPEIWSTLKPENIIDDFTAVLPIATKINPSRSSLFSIRDTSLHFAIVENSQGMLSGSVTKSRFCMCVCCSIILLYFQYNSPLLQPQRWVGITRISRTWLCTLSRPVYGVQILWGLHTGF